MNPYWLPNCVQDAAKYKGKKKKYNGKGIPEKQNGMYKGTEVRKGARAPANSLAMPELKVQSLGKQEETRLRKEPGSL